MGRTYSHFVNDRLTGRCMDSGDESHTRYMNLVLQRYVDDRDPNLTKNLPFSNRY